MPRRAPGSLGCVQTATRSPAREERHREICAPSVFFLVWEKAASYKPYLAVELSDLSSRLEVLCGDLVHALVGTVFLATPQQKAQVRG